jgi:uncharacterized protein YndB with AHSA1/START domain
MLKAAVTVAISATPAALWDALTDAPAYPRWNPAVESLTGDIRPQARLGLVLRGGQRFDCNVTAFTPPRHMTWTRSAPLGLFHESLSFSLRQDDEDYHVKFTLSDELTGPFAGLASPVAPPRWFEAFAAALKRHTSLP